MKKRSQNGPLLRPRFRVLCGVDILLGPGRADRLEHIRDTGSISEAAAQLRMSYMRAWQLVKAMNGGFREPLVKTVRGGSDQGGSSLTPMGLRVLKLYRSMEQRAMVATEADWERIRSLVRR